jgi:hypothetical protein
MIPAHQEPLKWKKYLKLIEYDLISIEELRRDIKRFKIDDAASLLRGLREELQQDADSGRSSLYVVKLVSLNQSGQLPNLRVQSPEDLINFDKFLRGKSRFIEIWYCRTAIDPGTFSVAGRFSFFYRDMPRSQVIEQVWRCSPRLIESFSNSASFPYARASRPEWGRHYNIEAIHCPNLLPIPLKDQEAQLRQSLLHLERIQKRIRSFLSFAELRGVDSISLEYKIVDAHLSIIDWDTTNDEKLLNA